jgi:hypothetical protein
MNTLINKRSMTLIVIWIIMILILVLLFIPYESLAREVEVTSDSSINESPIQQPEKQKQQMDPFNLSIVGISLGCMMFAASVNRTRTQRRQLEGSIQKYDSFLKNTSAVELYISGCVDNDPMMNSVKDIKEKRDIKINEYEEHKSVIAQSISEIEADIMGIWG